MINIEGYAILEERRENSPAVGRWVVRAFYDDGFARTIFLDPMGPAEGFEFAYQASEFLHGVMLGDAATDAHVGV